MHFKSLWNTKAKSINICQIKKNRNYRITFFQASKQKKKRKKKSGTKKNLYLIICFVMSDCGENRHTCTSQSNSSYLSWHHSTDSGAALLIYSCRKSGLCYSSFKPTTSKFLLCSLQIQEINNAWHCTHEDCPRLLLSQCPQSTSLGQFTCSVHPNTPIISMATER